MQNGTKNNRGNQRGLTRAITLTVIISALFGANHRARAESANSQSPESGESVQELNEDIHELDTVIAAIRRDLPRFEQTRAYAAQQGDSDDAERAARLIAKAQEQIRGLEAKRDEATSLLREKTRSKPQAGPENTASASDRRADLEYAIDAHRQNLAMLDHMSETLNRDIAASRATDSASLVEGGWREGRLKLLEQVTDRKATEQQALDSAVDELRNLNSQR